jgi:hypothetical protein
VEKQALFLMLTKEFVNVKNFDIGVLGVFGLEILKGFFAGDLFGFSNAVNEEIAADEDDS